VKYFNIGFIRVIFGLILLFTLSCNSTGFNSLRVKDADNSKSENFSLIAEKTLNETWSRITKYNFRSERVSDKWMRIYKKSRPMILKSRNPQELVFLINQMVRKLGQSHIHLMKPMSEKAKEALRLQNETRKRTSITLKNAEVGTDDKKSSSKRLGKKPAEPGLRLCVADGELCVLDVKKDSSAFAAGIKRGDVISSILGFKFDVSKYSDVPWDMLAEGLLTGLYGSKVLVSTIDIHGKKHDYVLERTSLLGEWIRVGVLPKISGKVEYKILKGNIGYILLTVCFPQQIIEMKNIITKQMKNCSGLIIDVRNNPGGMMMMAEALLGWVSVRELRLGKMRMRDTSLALTSTPQKEGFKRELALLVNGGSFSTAEIFAAAIKDNKRGELFGETTGGKCLSSVFFLLSTGYRLQTVVGDFTRINGKAIEHYGVKPDVVVVPTQKALALGIDPVCEKAREWLVSKMRP